MKQQSSLLFLTLLAPLIYLWDLGCAQKTQHLQTQYVKANLNTGDESILDFYSTQAPYGEFSNFAPFPIFLEGQWWPTSEHFYQAHKYENKKLQQWVQGAPTPMAAALRGRDPSIPKRADWEQKKDLYMELAVTDKFTRYPQLRKVLIETGHSRLFEHTKNDCYWGDCGDRSGQNKLGLLLEKIRGNLQKIPAPLPTKAPFFGNGIE